MPWQSGGVRTLALVFVGLAGCLPGSLYLKSPTNSAADEQVFVGTLELISQRTESVLKQLDIQYLTEPDGDGLRIRATTSRDGRFSVFLSREPAADRQPELVRVRFAWEGGPKEPAQFLIFQTLEALSPR